MNDTYLTGSKSAATSAVDEACRTFEAGWKAGQPTSIDSALAAVPIEVRASLLRRLLAFEITVRRGRGESITSEEYVARFPQEAAWIGQLTETDAETLTHQFMPPAGGVAEWTVPDSPAPPPPLAPADWPKMTGYELLEILGRGGMGVVYKARHLSLNRMVALKMILAGEHAGPEDRVRFFSEAEAVARLQHPNIVQIYEIGHRGDLPFFALEYVEGGNLAKYLRGRQVTCIEAAALMEKIARTIHYAHQRDVIHRDLKPANILLQMSGSNDQAATTATLKQGAPSAISNLQSATPKITDFGLAKRIEGGHGLTQTGQVLGTPAYMAPEQAAGKTKEIGPLSDVYALGVILYEMLTGKPPFDTGSFMGTVQQVLYCDARPPSQVQPAIPRDLETICLKALAKEPARRYSSALALAQDLERFLAGEPILARREGAIAKVWRTIRRRPLAATLTVLLTAALVVAGILAWSGLGSRRIADLHRQIETGLDGAAWAGAELPKENLDRVDALIAELEEVAPAEAATQRQRLQQRLVEWIQGQIRQPTMPQEQVARIEKALLLLSQRDAEAGGPLRLAFSERLQLWEKVFNLSGESSPPFAELESVFTVGQVEALGKVLVHKVKQKTPPVKSSINTLAFTRAECQGHVELEAVFDPSWSQAEEIGLWLNAQTMKEGINRRSGYGFLLRTRLLEAELPPMKKKGKKPVEAVETVTGLFLYIVRDGVRLLEREVNLPEGPLRLRVRRVGDRLSFQVNQLAAIEFQEVFPLSSAGKFAVQWPGDVGVRMLRASRQAMAPAPSPLEKGDDYYGRGLTDEAMTAFRQQAIAAGPTSAVGREARYKEALCLMAMNRAAEAIPVLERLAADNDKNWTPCALCRLWLISLQEKRSVDAENIFGRLSAQFRFNDLATLIPEEDRERILQQYRNLSLNVNLYKPDPNRIPAMERGSAAEKFLRGPGFMDSRWQLYRAHHALGNIDEAFRIVHEASRDADPARDTLQWNGLQRWIEEYTWLLRVRGDHKESLRVLNRWLAVRYNDQRPKYAYLLLERARTHAALENWQAADKDIEDYFRQVPVAHRGHYYLPACLIRGFIKDHFKDDQGAQAAWKEGFQHEVGTGWGLGWLSHLMVGSLTKEMTDAQAERLFQTLVKAMSGNEEVTGLTKLVRIPPATLREMWRSPRGRDFMPRFAFRTISFADMVRVPPMLLGAEVMRQGAFAGKVSPEQDDLIWNLVNELYDEYYFKQKINMNQVILLGATWKGNANLLGWTGVAPSLKDLPQLRGRMAYVFGHKYLRDKRTKDAVNFFRTALADAPPQSSLSRLAQAELDRLKK